jgi:hypothetical protein
MSKTRNPCRKEEATILFMNDAERGGALGRVGSELIDFA